MSGRGADERKPGSNVDYTITVTTRGSSGYRTQFLSRLDDALAESGIRIAPGIYKVTIQRLDPLSKPSDG